MKDICMAEKKEKNYLKENKKECLMIIGLLILGGDKMQIKLRVQIFAPFIDKHVPAGTILEVIKTEEKYYVCKTDKKEILLVQKELAEVLPKTIYEESIKIIKCILDIRVYRNKYNEKEVRIACRNDFNILDALFITGDEITDGQFDILEEVFEKNVTKEI